MKDNQPEDTTSEVALQPNQNGGEKTPMTLIEMAITNKVDVETIERLFALQERWEKNQAKKLFLSAFSKFQSKVPKIKKKKSVGYDTKDGSGKVDYKYAQLSEIAETLQPILQETGLTYRWEISEPEGKQLIECTCIISHTAGHSERTVTMAAKDTSGKKNDIQARGSAITYLQRYSLIGALGLTTANDDSDGRAKPAPEAKQEKPAKLTTEELAVLVKAIGEAPNEPGLLDWAAAQPERVRADASFRAAVTKKRNTFPKRPVTKPAGK